MAFGGTAMQETGKALSAGRTGQVARAILGVVLLILLAGIWACLWVPPGPTFYRHSGNVFDTMQLQGAPREIRRIAP
jgi:hypothetical protein